MAQKVIVTLTDDIDGGSADETIDFSLDGKSYQIDLNKRNAAAMRKAFQSYIDAGRAARRSTSRAKRQGEATQFSQLNSEEKERFRAWANLPDARRISDTRVMEWIDAGRP